MVCDFDCDELTDQFPHPAVWLQSILSERRISSGGTYHGYIPWRYAIHHHAGGGGCINFTIPFFLWLKLDRVIKRVVLWSARSHPRAGFQPVYGFFRYVPMDYLVITGYFFARNLLAAEFLWKSLPANVICNASLAAL